MSKRTFSFYVIGEPKAQQRPRAFAIQRRGKPPLVRVYNPATAEFWKEQVAKAAKEAQLEKLEGAIGLSLFFSFPRPKSHFDSKGYVKRGAPDHHLQRPDFDNLAKAVADALTSVGAWDDDCQLVQVQINKGWALGSSRGGCAVTITELS